MNNKNVTIQLIIFPYIFLSFAFSMLNISCTKPKEKEYKIGLINANPGFNKITEGFIAGLNDFGYIEGESVTYLRHDRSSDSESAARNMAAEKADLIFTVTTPSTKKAINAVKDRGLPVVFGAVFDPVDSGIVKSISVPGGNATGIQVSGSTVKALDWLLKISPGIKHIFAPVSFDTKAADLSLSDLKRGADKLKIKLTVAETASAEMLQDALSSMPVDIDALFVLNSLLIVSNLQMIVKKAIELQLPVGSGTGQYINGVTISYGQNHFFSGRQASRIAHKILQGASPGEIPVEMSDYFLGINLKTARASGLLIPEDVLQQADSIIR